VATTALIIRRDSTAPARVGDVGEAASTTYVPGVASTTISIPGVTETNVSAGLVWNALSAIGIAPADETEAATMPTPDLIGCTSDICRPMFAYVVWHEIARALGFGDVFAMQELNPNVDFGVPPVDGQVLQTSYSSVVPTTWPATTTTGPNGERSFVVLVNSGAPDGAVDDAMSRLAMDFEVGVETPAGSAPWDHSAVIPVNQQIGDGVVQFVGLPVESSDPELVATFSNDAIALIVIGPDYWDVIPSISTVAPTTIMYPGDVTDYTTTTTTIVSP
jgi:hypothetical protein